MAHEVPTTEPTEGVAGDSWQWDVSYSDYPASDGWQLAYALRGPEDLDIVWSTHVSANGDGFEVRVPASVTDLAAGTYTLFGHVTKGSDRHTVYGLNDGEGTFTVRPNPTTAVDAQSHDEKMLAFLEATIETLAQDQNAAVTRGSRTWQYRDMDELLRLQNIYRSRVAAARQSGAFGPCYEATFRAPA